MLPPSGAKSLREYQAKVLLHLASVGKSSKFGTSDEALAFFLSGDFAKCSDLVSDRSDSSRQLLWLRSQYSRGNFSEVSRSITDLLPSIRSNPIAGQLLCIQLACAWQRGDYGSALQIGPEVRARCYSAGVPAIEAEMLVTFAGMHFKKFDFESARADVEACLELAARSSSWIPCIESTFSIRFWQARALEYLAHMNHSQGDFDEKIRNLEDAISLHCKSESLHSFFHANSLANLIEQSLETDCLLHIERMKNLACAFQWNDATRQIEFRSFMTLGRFSALVGDEVGALREFRRSSACATSSIAKVEGFIERAQLFKEIGEISAARDQFDEVVRLATQANVSRELLSNTNASALVSLLIESTFFDKDVAVDLVGRYPDLLGSGSVATRVDNDEFESQRHHLRARMARLNGDISTYCRLLRLSLDSSPNRLTLRRARIAIELFEETKDPVAQSIANEFAKHFSKSAFSRSHRALIKATNSAASSIN